MTLFNKYLIVNVWLALFASNVFSQSERKLVREGNKQYESKKYDDAEMNYRRSLEKNKNSYTGTYNLGDALYKQKKYDEAVQQFNNSMNLSKDKKDVANSYHNLGNSLLESKKYQESVDAYKNALKINPNDNDTRYNLAYAQTMLKQQQQQQQQNQKDNKDNKDNKDKKQQQQNKQEQEQKNQQQKEQEAKQQQQPPPKISKEDAERILQALKNNEKDLQKKNAKKEGAKISVEKQW